MSGKTVWTFVATPGTATFTRVVNDEFEPTFNGKYPYTKDLVLGATTAGGSYIDLAAFEVGPMSMRIEFTSSALRDAFLAYPGLTGTLSNTRSRTYTAMLVDFKRIDDGVHWWADVVWEQR